MFHACVRAGQCAPTKMKLACVLALCAFGVVSGTETKSSTGTTNNRHRRSSLSGKEVFLSIIGERNGNTNNINAPVLPVQLPIQLGGQGGVTLPVLVVPVPVYVNNPDSCSANHHEAPAKPAEPTQPLPNIPYVQIRQQLDNEQTNDVKVPLKPQPTLPSQEEEEAPYPTRPTEINPVLINQELEDIDEDKPKRLRLPGLSRGNSPSLKFQSVNAPTPTVNVYIPKGSLNLNLGVSGREVKFTVDNQETSLNVPKSPKLTIPGYDGGHVNDGDDNKKEEQKEEDNEYKKVEDNESKKEEGYTPAINYDKIPFSDGSPIFETSEQMIQSFVSQTPVAPELPAVIPNLNLPERLFVTKPLSSVNPPLIRGPSPPRPDFNHSMRLRVDLTVPNSDYTEAYDIQWHAESNTAKSVVEDGSTIFYRAPLADGRIQFLQIQVDPNDGTPVRRCTLSPLMPASPAEKRFPGLPEFDQFEFIGYTSAEGRSLVERWQRVVSTGPGEGGAAEGETLNFTHEMLVIRDRGLAVPLRYTVMTDSSVLGRASDSYTHRYSQLQAPTAAVLPDTSRECDTFDEFQDHEHHEHHEHEHIHDYHQHEHEHEHKNEHSDHEYQGSRLQRDIGRLLSRVVSKFDPLREFSGPTRDTRYDSIYATFKQQFKRNYLDPAEEALRKNLLVKSSRFIDAGNRLASGFKMATNFLADRLDDEINQLFGVQALPEGASERGLVPFPYSDTEVNTLSNKLDNEFDWRPLGAVSPVRFQETTCSSCWAFAVAGSTEGALFKKTNKLVPLSPQCLVDCGKPFGTNGCNGTWPSFAYDYVQARGLPAWDEYTNYQAKVLECKTDEVPPVTHISGHVNVTAFNEAALKLAIKNHAPNVVIVDAKANSFIYYKSGVLKDKRCGQNKPRLNHAVLAVGWGTKDGPHFIIKNTWSAKWGEEGYIRIAPDACAVMERPSYALVEENNIDREELRVAA